MSKRKPGYQSELRDYVGEDQEVPPIRVPQRISDFLTESRRGGSFSGHQNRAHSEDRLVKGEWGQLSNITGHLDYANSRTLAGGISSRLGLLSTEIARLRQLEIVISKSLKNVASDSLALAHYVQAHDLGISVHESTINSLPPRLDPSLASSVTSWWSKGKSSDVENIISGDTTVFRLRLVTAEETTDGMTSRVARRWRSPDVDEPIPCEIVFRADWTWGEILGYLKQYASRCKSSGERALRHKDVLSFRHSLVSEAIRQYEMYGCVAGEAPKADTGPAPPVVDTKEEMQQVAVKLWTMLGDELGSEASSVVMGWMNAHYRQFRPSGWKIGSSARTLTRWNNQVNVHDLTAERLSTVTEIAEWLAKTRT